MTCIWKFPLAVTGEQTILLPKSAEVLSLQAQNNIPCIWALVDTEEPREKWVEWEFYMFGTGQQCELGQSRFVGTFQMSEGAFVFHVFTS